VFYLDVAYVLQWFSSVSCVFLQVFQTNVSNVSSVFRRMLQMFYLDVLKVDRMLHISQWCRWLADSGLLQGFGIYLARRALPSPVPSLPFLPSAATVQARRETLPDKHANTLGGGGPGWADGGTMLA